MNASANPAALFMNAAPEGEASGARFAWPGRSQVPAQERVNFTSQLAMMVTAGVSLSSALKSIARQCQHAKFAAILTSIQEDVLGGSSLSAAIQKHPNTFDAAYVATVAAGEASGKMPTVLGQLAELQRADLKLKRTIRGMLIYPVLLTLVSLGVIAALVVVVLPRFATIFEQYEIVLPLATRFLMGIADEIHARWWLWGPLALAVLGGLVAARATQQGRDLVDTAMLRTPGLKRVTQTLIGAKACRLLGLLVSSGVPLLECLQLLRKAVSNCLFRELTRDLEEAVTNGKSLSDALENNEVLPPSAAEMIATAERTGKLGEVSLMMGIHYDEEGQAVARQLISFIEPLVTIVMGGVVAFVVLAVMLPVFDIATIAQR